MCAQGEARAGVCRFGKYVDYLLNVLHIHFLAAVEVFYVKTGEAAGVF